jgi:hypothetical protein
MWHEIAQGIEVIEAEILRFDMRYPDRAFLGGRGGRYERQKQT